MRRPQADSAPAANPLGGICAQCGTVLSGDKRFCRQCGHATGATTATAPPPREQWTPAPEIRKTLPLEPVEPYPTPGVPPPPPVQEWQPVAFTPNPGKTGPSKAKFALLIGIPAAVLLAATGGWAWYAHTHRCGNCGTTAAAVPQQPIDETASQNPAPTTPAAKPPAGSAAAHSSGAPKPSIIPAPNPSPAPLPPFQPSVSAAHGNPAAPTPTFLPTPKPGPIQNVAGKSGIEHYQGPPVPYGGKVVFQNLPQARLKFTFDTTSWKLTIKLNPDGTKNVILTSTQQGTLTSCDLGWQVVE